MMEALSVGWGVDMKMCNNEGKMTEKGTQKRGNIAIDPLGGWWLAVVGWSEGFI